ncbi:response regulator transcription factor [Enterobacter sp. UNJFSC 003]|uniref:response regulator transcription factor n=1 Tax=Enterobacter sp. UNJFSC 003 TaxID=3122077 RepID=UPI002EC671B0|nr:response regulator transcription factor [Serratia liquefaciens]
MKKKSESQKILRITVLDEQPIVCRGIQSILTGKEGLELIGLFGNRHDLIAILRSREVDLLVLDYQLGGEEIDGLYLIKYLRAQFPRLKILIYSSIASPAILQLVMHAGVRGYVSKNEDTEMVVHAIRQVGGGKTFITHEMQRQLDRFREADAKSENELWHEGANISVLKRDLSPRETEVIRCYLAGMTLMQIAAKYSRSRKTISCQKQTALRKLGLRSDLELFKYGEHLKLS